VVVVVMMRVGSRGSGPLLDCENLREPRLAAASSLHSELVYRSLDVTWTYSWKECGNDLKNCFVVCSLSDTTSVANRSNVSCNAAKSGHGIVKLSEKRTLRKGRPRLVTFIICELPALPDIVAVDYELYRRRSG